MRLHHVIAGPLMAHLVVTRRCNLSCGYCYEADRTSAHVPITALRERIGHLRRLNTCFVTLTGGEPLLHPDAVELVAHTRSLGMTPVMNSNVYPLTLERIVALGRAGLYALQTSIDNVEPDGVTRKSLRPLLPKLELLAEHATFRVRVNTVLGSGPPAVAVQVARAAIALGFDAKCSLVRDAKGRVIPLDAEGRRAYAELTALEGRAPGYLSEDFQLALADSGRVEWKCRSGARYFTVCDQGLVHLCESSYGSPGTPLADYGEADLRRAWHTPKACASTCAVAYAHQLSRLDARRSQSAASLDVVKQCWSEAAAS